jgi:hypothetical protein
MAALGKATEEGSFLRLVNWSSCYPAGQILDVKPVRRGVLGQSDLQVLRLLEMIDSLSVAFRQLFALRLDPVAMPAPLSYGVSKTARDAAERDSRCADLWP